MISLLLAKNVYFLLTINCLIFLLDFHNFLHLQLQIQKIIAKQKYERQKIEEEKAQNYQYEDLFNM